MSRVYSYDLTRLVEAYRDSMCNQATTDFGRKVFEMTYTGVARGRTIELDEGVPYSDGQSVKIAIEPIPATVKNSTPHEVLAAVRSLPDIDLEDIAELERTIAFGMMPVEARSVSDD